MILLHHFDIKWPNPGRAVHEGRGKNTFQGGNQSQGDLKLPSERIKCLFILNRYVWTQ